MDLKIGERKGDKFHEYNSPNIQMNMMELQPYQDKDVKFLQFQGTIIPNNGEKPRHSYTREDLKNAVEAVKTGRMKQREAERVFRVPRRTIFDNLTRDPLLLLTGKRKARQKKLEVDVKEEPNQLTTSSSDSVLDQNFEPWSKRMKVSPARDINPDFYSACDQFILDNFCEVKLEVGQSNESGPAKSKVLTKNMTTNTLASVEKALNGWLKPKVFAESWDNVGLLMGSGRSSKEEKSVNNILLCNDLTTKVVAEAISSKSDLIIAYHPPIFSPLKAVAYGSWKEQIVAKCLAHDISVYSPHTTVDSVIGGINDRIMESIREIQPTGATLEAITPSSFFGKSSVGVEYKGAAKDISALYSAAAFNDISDVTVAFDVSNVVQGRNDSVSFRVYTSENASGGCLAEIQNIANTLDVPALQQVTTVTPPALGAGRILRFASAVRIGEVVEMLRSCTGVPTIKLAEGSKPDITSVALCVGSGASILKGLDVDVVITGEMSHHDVLDCLEAGQSVILCGHADSERHYLPTLAEIVKIITQCENVSVSSADQSLFRFV